MKAVHSLLRLRPLSLTKLFGSFIGLVLVVSFAFPLFAAASGNTPEVAALVLEVESTLAMVQEYLANIDSMKNDINVINGSLEGLEISPTAAADDGWYNEGRYVLDAFKNDMLYRLDTMNSRLSALESGGKDYTSQLDAILQQLSNASGSLDSIIGMLGVIQGSITTLNSSLISVQMELSNVNSQLSGIRSDIAGVRVDLDAIKSELKGVNQTLLNVNNNLFQLVGVTYQIHSEITDIRLMLQEHLKIEEEFDKEGMQDTVDDVGEKQREMEQSSPDVSGANLKSVDIDSSHVERYYSGFFSTIGTIMTYFPFLTELVALVGISFIASIVGKSY